MQRLRTRLRAGVSTFPPATFALNFLTGGLDPAVTFSRGSNATLVDSTGKITYAPANLVLQSQTFDAAAWTLFRSSVSPNSVVAPDGSLTADLIIPDTSTINAHGSYTTSPIAVANSTAHIVSVYAKAMGYNFLNMYFPGSTSSVGAMFNLATGVVGSKGASVTSSTMTSVGDGWYRCSMTVTTSGTTADIRVYAGISDNGDGTTPAYAGNGSSGIAVWGAQLEPVTYQTTPGTYNATTSAAYYGPRFDYDPATLAAKGLLIEEQRTNLLLRSEEFDNASWIKAGATVTANNTTSPDGTVDADKLVEDTSSGGHYVSAIAAVTSGTAYTVSVYVKASGRSWVRVVFGAGFATTNTWFDIANGTVGTIGATSASIQNAGNGWYRVTATQSATSSTSGQFFIAAETSGSSTSYTGDGTSGVFIWGAQLEAGAFATSYIPTVASQVTRSADVATMTGTNFSSWYNQSEGTIFVGFTGTPALTASIWYPNSLGGPTVSDNDGGNNVRVSLRGVAYVDTGGTPTTAGTQYKTAFGYKQSDYASSTNGGAVQTSANATAPTAQTALGIGSTGSLNWINGHIRQIAYYNTRLPDATLQALTV